MSFDILFCFMLLLGTALSRQLPRYENLEEEDQHLFRAAYDTPSYDQDEYHEENDLSLGKLDLLKDGMWAIKAKVKEVLAFNKALAANLLASKMKLKDLLENHLDPIKKHHHTEVEKKPSYGYQPPSYPQYPAPPYNAPHYGHDPYYGH